MDKEVYCNDFCGVFLMWDHQAKGCQFYLHRRMELNQAQGRILNKIKIDDDLTNNLTD